MRKREKREKRKGGPPVFTFERTLKRPELSPRAAEYGLVPVSATTTREAR